MNWDSRSWLILLGFSLIDPDNPVGLSGDNFKK